MASAGQAHAHSSQPTHFSSPSACRLSWCRPWKRAWVSSLTSGYCTVLTLLNMVRKVRPKPFNASNTGVALLPLVAARPRQQRDDRDHDEARDQCGHELVAVQLGDRRPRGRDDEQPDQSGRYEALPAEPHELVVAQP